MQVDVEHGSQREMGNETDMHQELQWASRHASLSPVHPACAEWLEEGSVRSTAAGDLSCPVHELLPSSINEGRTMSHCSCGDARKHGGKQKNETQLQPPLPEKLVSAAQVSALKSTLMSIVFPLAEVA